MKVEKKTLHKQSGVTSIVTISLVVLVAAVLIIGGIAAYLTTQKQDSKDGIVESKKVYEGALYDSHAHPSAILEEEGQEFVSLMKEHGVKNSIITPWINPAEEEERVGKARNLIASSSDIFAPFFIIWNEEDKLVTTRDDLSRLHTQNSDILRGWGEFALWGSGLGADILSPPWREMYGYAQENNLIVMMHPAEQHEEEMRTIVEEYPDLTLLLHGDESFHYLPDIMNASENVFFTVDTMYMLRSPDDDSLPLFDAETAEEFMKIYDAQKERMVEAAVENWLPLIEAYPERTLWGTDIGHEWHGDSRVYDRLVAFSRKFIHRLPDKIRDKYAYSNAERLFVQKTEPDEQLVEQISKAEEPLPTGGVPESPAVEELPTAEEPTDARDLVPVASIFKDGQLLAQGELVHEYPLSDFAFGDPPAGCGTVVGVFNPEKFSADIDEDESFSFVCSDGATVEVRNEPVPVSFAQFRRENGLNIPRFPLDNGTFYISQDGTGASHSREAGAGEFAWDIAKLAPWATGDYETVEEHGSADEMLREQNDLECGFFQKPEDDDNPNCACQYNPDVYTYGASPTDYLGFGDNIYAPLEGVVYHIADTSEDICPSPEVDFNEGNELVLHLKGGYYLWFMHLRQGSVEVEPGQVVQPGTKIAELGNTGITIHPHLHFSLLWLGKMGEEDVAPSFSPGWSIPTAFENIYVKPARNPDSEAKLQREYEPVVRDFISNNAFRQPR